MGACVPNVLAILQAARSAGVRVFFVPRHRDRGREGEIEGWKYIAPIQNFGHERRLFEAGAWGGTFRDEFTPLPGELLRRNTGAPAASRTPTWISNLRSMVSMMGKGHTSASNTKAAAAGRDNMAGIPSSAWRAQGILGRQSPGRLE
jgi:hypothetical protein